MALRHFAEDTPDLRAKWGDFAWDETSAVLSAIDVVFGECDR